MGVYVPSTDEVRKNMAFGVAAAQVLPHQAADIDWPWPEYRNAAKVAFDLWYSRLDSHGYFRLAHWVALSGVAALSLVAGLLVGLIIGAHT